MNKNAKLVDLDESRKNKEDTRLLDGMFTSVATYCDKLYDMLKSMEEQIGKLPVLFRMKVKNNFQESIGISVGEMRVLVVNIYVLWKDIKKAIHMASLNDIETQLRTYTYEMLELEQYLSSLEKYSIILNYGKYIKDKSQREMVKKFSLELNTVAQQLSKSLKDIYTILVMPQR